MSAGQAETDKTPRPARIGESESPDCQSGGYAGTLLLSSCLTRHPDLDGGIAKPVFSCFQRYENDMNNKMGNSDGKANEFGITR